MKGKKEGMLDVFIHIPIVYARVCEFIDKKHIQSVKSHFIYDVETKAQQ